MKELISKISVASGFLVLLSGLGWGLGFVINEYEILAKEHEGLLPSNQRIALESCTDGSKRVVRTFAVQKAAKDIPILTYHRIVDEKDIVKKHYINGKVNPMIVTKADFNKQMTYLKDEGYVTLSLNELHGFLNRDIALPEKSVVITFDDGYKDNFIEAYPILKKYDFKAVNFIITGAISNKVHPYTPEHVQYFGAKELRKGCDVFEYQSHTYSFHKREKKNGVKTSYLLSKSKDDVVNDIHTSIFQLGGERLGFAYPYGEYSPESIKIIKQAGFKMAFTTEERAASPKDHMYEIPRFQILYNTTLQEFKQLVK
ncbi:polysaccharide deacetylase family protein [Fictibacillus sp. 26RED30]|uniref:polysaccharide deacetylase family protein n=1 Tax=Fictibacillus sp. 26RED30 TaxID=2745877 RepID=UPI0018CED9F2|nr:polysaccharide deacetylase family protein [Fictibacillus sp. 26RED30]MBH0161891.1 polysaccharide deacetylase family protein [Fictibacillus sp. 26RED30]